MKIKWTIEKQQGNFRPILNYTLTLEAFEKELAVPSVRIVSKIPHIPESRQRFCLPNTHEREHGWIPNRYVSLSTPSFRNKDLQARVILPYVSDPQFAYVEESFKILREAFEIEMQAAKDSEALLLRKELCLTENTRQNMATDIAANKILQLVGA